jgi:HPt (histidine-containing phosphotransfer) domain-containing protein
MLIDHEALLGHVDGDRELARSLARMFAEQIPLLMERVMAAIRGRQLAALGPLLHRLRGSLATLGGIGAAADTRAIERAARQDGWAEAEALGRAMEHTIGSMILELGDLFPP